jgi:hypothetical protein
MIISWGEKAGQQQQQQVRQQQYILMESRTLRNAGRNVLEF